jgi:hypothetical protein
MSTNCFRDEELVSRKMNGQQKSFPVVGGRLRLAHDENERLSLQTELVNWDGQYAVFKCMAITTKGQFVGYGTANSQRDARLSESLIELAETRSVARALRFAGYGMEYTGAEEVSHVAGAEQGQTANKTTAPIFKETDKQNETESKPQAYGIGLATQSQCRALYALTKKAQYTDQDIQSLLSPLNATTFQELTRESASKLITYLQTEVAA